MDGKLKSGHLGHRDPSSHVTTIKVVLVGSMGVGKTSLVLRCCRGTAERNTRVTVAVDWLRHIVNVHGQTVNLQIWDTVGLERFRTVVSSFIRNSSGVLLVYDVTDKNSFSASTMWLNIVKREEPNAVVMLVANKVDDPQRIICTEEGEIFATEHGLLYTETSAITGHNVENVFHDLADRIMCSHMALGVENLDKFQLKDDLHPGGKCSC